MGRREHTIVLCVVYLTLGDGGYVQDRISAFNNLTSAGILFTDGTFTPLGSDQHYAISYNDVVAQLDQHQRSQFTNEIWDRYASRQSSVVLSREELAIRRECVEILKTNMFAPSDCDLPVFCANPTWEKFSSGFFGYEIGICYSALNFNHAADNNLVILEPSKHGIFTVGKFDVVHMEELPFVFFSHLKDQTLGAMHLSIATRHPEVNFGVHVQPSVKLMAENYCFLEMISPLGELIIDFSYAALLEKINPLLLVTSDQPPVHIFCPDIQTNLLFSSLEHSFYGSVTRGQICDSVIVPKFYNDSTYYCYPVVESYTDPVLKPIKKMIKFILDLVIQTISYLLSDILDILYSIVQSLLKLVSDIYDKLYSIFSNYLLRFVIILLTLYIYDTKLIRDLLLTLLFVVFSFIFDQVCANI